MDDKEAMFRRSIIVFFTFKFSTLSYRTQEIHLKISNYICRLAKEQLKPIDGLYKLRKWIEDRGLKRAAVTNAPRSNAELMISFLGLTDFFEAIIIGSECERAKPFPDPYLKALELLKVSKDHTIIFEVIISPRLVPPCSDCLLCCDISSNTRYNIPNMM